MSHAFSQAWKALATHFGAHLLLDIQIAITAQLAPYAPRLLGVH